MNRPRNIPPRSHWRWSPIAWTLVAFLAGSACGDGGPALPRDGGGGQSDAGGPDAGVVSSAKVCDDGNACTVDSVDGDRCRFDAARDGTICEDGDLCTLGDRCQSGECRAGARASGGLSLLGRLDDLTGKHVAMGPGRFVTVSRDEVLDARVQLVSRTADGLATLSSWQGYLGLVVIGVNEILTHAFPDSGVVAVAAQQDRQLRLFSAGETEVSPRGEVELSGQIIWMAGHGHRLWLCTRDFFTGNRITLVDVGDPDQPTEVGGIALGGSACGSVAISEDGHRIYANTSDGVRFVDAAPLDEGGDPTLSEVIAPPAGVNVSGSHLILTTPTGVRILNESDRVEVVAVAVTRARAATLVGDRLLIEGSRAAGAGTEIFVAWYDALGASGPTLLDQVVVSTHPGPPETSSFRSATDGATLITGTRMFDLTRDRLDGVKVPQLIPMRSLARTGHGVRAYVNSGAAAIDVSDVAKPGFVAGGAFGTPAPVLRIAIDDSLPMPAFVSGLGQGLEDPTRVPIDSSNYFFASPIPIHRWNLDENADLRSEDSFSLPHRGQSQLLVAGDFMYRLVRPSVPSPGARLQGYWLPALRGGATAVPVFDLDVSASTMRGGFDVDPRSRVAVVSTEASGTSGDLAPALIFYDLRTSPPTLLEQLPTDAVYSQMRVSGDRVVVVAYNVIVFYQRGQGEVSRQAVTERTGAQLLAFDGRVAYLGQLHLVAGASAYELAAATFGDDTPPVLVIVDGIARSLVAIDGGLAVGFETEVLTVHPHCP